MIFWLNIFMPLVTIFGGGGSGVGSAKNTKIIWDFVTHWNIDRNWRRITTVVHVIVGEAYIRHWEGWLITTWPNGYFHGWRVEVKIKLPNPKDEFKCSSGCAPSDSKSFASSRGWTYDLCIPFYDVQVQRYYHWAILAVSVSPICTRNEHSLPFSSPHAACVFF